MMEFWISQLFNGISYSALLFLMASGLSLIFGIMRIVNLAHGAYFLLGGYLALTVRARGGYLAAMIFAIVGVALVGIIMQRFFLRKLEKDALSQVLMTMGFALVFQDVALIIWGGDPYTLLPPQAFAVSLVTSVGVFPAYRIFMVGVAVAVGVGLSWLMHKTRLGAVLRAAVDDQEMARAVGIRVPRLSTGVFALGAMLAGLGGAIGAGFIGVYPGADFEILPYAFVVVIVGGLGSIPGAIVGSLVVGLLDNFGKALFPELSYFTLFAPMALVLALRPGGLFGRS
jgi:branched-chain amino acid transport system permease protein